MFKLYCEFTRNGSFASWESGSLSGMTKKGWSVLVADPEGKPLQTLFSRNPARTPNHYLFRVDIGYLVVVTNIRPWEVHNTDLVTVKTAIAYFTNLKATPVPNKPKQSTVSYDTQILWSESLIASKASLKDKIAELEIKIPTSTDETLARLREMVAASVEKAMTLPEKQRLFWGIPRQERAPQSAEKAEAAAEPAYYDEPADLTLSDTDTAKVDPSVEISNT